MTGVRKKASSMDFQNSPGTALLDLGHIQLQKAIEPSQQLLPVVPRVSVRPFVSLVSALMGAGVPRLGHLVWLSSTLIAFLPLDDYRRRSSLLDAVEDAKELILTALW